MGRRRILLLPLALGTTLMVGASLALPSPTLASIVSLTAVLDSSQEVPPSVSPGSGSATMSFDTVSNLFSWDIAFADLTGPAVAAHFHGPAPPGANAGVQVDIGAISGLTSPMIGSTTITDAQESDLLAGLWYINIHTENFPPGEIRGQVLVAAPEPASVLLLGAGLAGLAGLGWRRRRRT